MNTDENLNNYDERYNVTNEEEYQHSNNEENIEYQDDEYNLEQQEQEDNEEMYNHEINDQEQFEDQEQYEEQENQSETIKNTNINQNNIDINDLNDDNDEQEVEQEEEQKEENNEDAEEDNTTLDIKVKRIFEYYSSYGERLNLNLMGSTKFAKFASESGLIKSMKVDKNMKEESGFITKTELDLIFSSLTKKAKVLSLDLFTKSLVSLSKYYCDRVTKEEESKKDKLKRFLNDLFLPLYNKIFPSLVSNSAKENNNKSALYDINNCDNFLLIDEIVSILENAGVGLYCIYKTYFKHEITITNNKLNYIKDLSYKNYNLFLKDFDLCPTIVSKSAATLSYHTLLDINILSEEAFFKILSNVDFGKLQSLNSNCSSILGNCFTFFKFVRMIVKLAEISLESLSKEDYEKISNSINNCKKTNNNDFQSCHDNQLHDLRLFDMLAFIIEKMENSSGFINLEKMTHITHNAKTTFILKKGIVNEIRDRLKAKIISNSNSNINYSSKTAINSPNIENVVTSHQSPELNDESINKEYDESNLFSYIYNNYASKLLIIFEVFCSFGNDKNETKFLKSPNFYKLLKDSDLLHNIKTNKLLSFNTSINKSTNKITQNSGRPMMLLNSNNSRSRVVSSNSNISQDKSQEPKLNSNDVDIIFINLVKLCNNKKKGIDFKSFIHGIIFISGILNTTSQDVREHISYIVEEKILKNNLNYILKNQEKQEKIELLEALKSESEEDLLIINALSISMETVFLYYSSNLDSKEKKFKGLLNMDQMLTFCYDFKIFPDLISKVTLIYYFKKKAEEISEEIYKNFNSSLELIDFSGFSDILCLIAIDLPMQEEPFIVRINALIDHMANSFGQEYIFKKSGHKIKQEPIKHCFKQNLPVHYQNQSNKGDNMDKSVSGFYDILLSN